MDKIKSLLKDEDKKIAYVIVKMLGGLDLTRAIVVLGACKDHIESNSTVNIS